MLEAIRQGNKTVTRRPDNLKITNQEPESWYFVTTLNHGLSFGFGYKKHYSEVIIKPRYLPGETVYVKETLFHHPYLDEAGYVLDQSPVFINQTIGDNLKWRWKKDILSSLFMPREAARTFIKILDVRPERVQEITPEDVVLEGIADIGAGDLRGMYAVLWESINPAFPWSSNPWCWRLEFLMAERPK